MWFQEVAPVRLTGENRAVARNPKNVQWGFQVEKELDKAVRKAAADAGMPLSAFIRAVLRGYLDMPGGLKK